MDPKQIGSVGLASSAGGGVLGAFGSLASGVSNSNMYNYQAGVAKLNQQIDSQNAEFAIQTGNQENQKLGFQEGARIGQEKAAQGASGFDLRSGSGAQVISSQQGLDRTSMAQLRSNTAKTAFNYEEQATVAGGQAGLYKSAASQSLVSGAIGAGSSILGTAGSVSSQWLQGQRVGLWNSSGGGGSSSYGVGGYGDFGA